MGVLTHPGEVAVHPAWQEGLRACAGLAVGVELVALANGRLMASRRKLPTTPAV